MPDLLKFLRKSYRDGYLQTQVRSGIAYQIQALREKFGLSQTAFAEKIGKKQSIVSRLENTEYGKVTVQTLLDIACANDVALLVQFVSYPDFLARTSDMTKEALQPKTILETLAPASANTNKSAEAHYIPRLLVNPARPPLMTEVGSAGTSRSVTLRAVIAAGGLQ